MFNWFRKPESLKQEAEASLPVQDKPAPVVHNTAIYAKLLRVSAELEREEARQETSVSQLKLAEPAGPEPLAVRKPVLAEPAAPFHPGKGRNPAAA